jgi:hypothetical protein
MAGSLLFYHCRPLHHAQCTVSCYRTHHRICRSHNGTLPLCGDAPQSQSENEQHKINWVKFAAVISGGILFLTLIAAMRSTTLGAYALPAPSDIGFVQNVGMKLFTDFALPFEVSSILFLSAMIGAVVLAKKEK